MNRRYDFSRLVILIIIPLLTYGASYSQSRLNVQIGINGSTFKVDPDNYEIDPKTGFSINVSYPAQIGDYLEVDGSLGYIVRGSKADNVDYTLQYLDLGLTLKPGLHDDSGAIYLIGGFRYNTLLQAKTDFNGTVEKISDRIRPIDYGFDLGFGLRWRSFYIEGTGYIGLHNISEEESEDISNRGTIFKVGWRFTL